MRALAEEMDVALHEHDLMPPPVQLPPWQWRLVDCNISFVDVAKHAPAAHICMHFLELRHKYSFVEFFTDALKTRVGVSYTAVGPSFSDAGILHPNTSIFTVKVYAVLVALKHIKQSDIPRAVIYTDSLSVVKALSTPKSYRNAVIMSI